MHIKGERNIVIDGESVASDSRSGVGLLIEDCVGVKLTNFHGRGFKHALKLKACRQVVLGSIVATGSYGWGMELQDCQGVIGTGVIDASANGLDGLKLNGNEDVDLTGVGRGNGWRAAYQRSMNGNAVDMACYGSNRNITLRWTAEHNWGAGINCKTIRGQQTLENIRLIECVCRHSLPTSGSRPGLWHPSHGIDMAVQGVQPRGIQIIGGESSHNSGDGIRDGGILDLVLDGTDCHDNRRWDLSLHARTTTSLIQHAIDPKRIYDKRKAA